MPNWGKIHDELSQLRLAQANGALPLAVAPSDLVRRKYLSALAKLTNRHVIIYASDWTSEGAQSGVEMTIEDMQGFMNAVHGANHRELDLILHLPGGGVAASERIGKYLRDKFDHIRVFVPMAAMSDAL